MQDMYIGLVIYIIQNAITNHKINIYLTIINDSHGVYNQGLV
jgi:hypothetical protein